MANGEGTGSNGDIVRRQLAAEIVTQRQWLADAVETVTGDRSVPVEAVFEQPMQGQADSRGSSAALPLSTRQESVLREIAGRFGIGGEQDITATEVGLPDGYVHVNEGGLAWKMLAEAELEDPRAGAIIYAASHYVRLNSEEQGFEKQVFGASSSRTQYDMARRIAETRQGFVPLAQYVDLPFGYDIQNGSKLLRKPTGQLTQIGTRDGRPVMMLGVDREDYRDAEGNPKYRKQPDTAALMRFMADVLEAQGNPDTPVVIATSSTYASRGIDVRRAGLAKDRQFDMLMYGQGTLADVKKRGAIGKGTSEPVAINQIPGELRVIHDKLNLLDEALREGTV